MTVADDHIAHHRHVQALYEELLGSVEGITMHRNPSPEYDFFIPIKINEPTIINPA